MGVPAIKKRSREKEDTEVDFLKVCEKNRTRAKGAIATLLACCSDHGLNPLLTSKVQVSTLLRGLK